MHVTENILVWKDEISVRKGYLVILSGVVDARGGSEEFGRSGWMWRVKEIFRLDLMCVV